MMKKTGAAGGAVFRKRILEKGISRQTIHRVIDLWKKKTTYDDIDKYQVAGEAYMQSNIGNM
jgi:hypothetical protein